MFRKVGWSNAFFWKQAHEIGIPCKRCKDIQESAVGQPVKGWLTEPGHDRFGCGGK